MGGRPSLRPVPQRNRLAPEGKPGDNDNDDIRSPPLIAVPFPFANRLIPAPLHRALLQLAQRLRVQAWGLLRMEQRGTNALVFDPAGRLLLVRHSYHHSNRWLLPGGGMGRRESPACAAVREVVEETGCLAQSAQWFATLHRAMPEGWTNRLELVCVTTATAAPRADGRELLEAAFFALDQLPATTAATTHQSIAEWRAWVAAGHPAHPA